MIDRRKELKAEKRQKQLEAEKAELWDCVEAQGGINAIAALVQVAAEWAEQMRRTEQVKAEIENQVLITEIDQK